MSIHPSIMFTAYPLRELETNPGERITGDTIPLTLPTCLWAVGGSQSNKKKTHRDRVRTCKLHTERQWQNQDLNLPAVLTTTPQGCPCLNTMSVSQLDPYHSHESGTETNQWADSYDHQSHLPATYESNHEAKHKRGDPLNEDRHLVRDGIVELVHVTVKKQKTTESMESVLTAMH